MVKGGNTLLSRHVSSCVVTSIPCCSDTKCGRLRMRVEETRVPANNMQIISGSSQPQGHQCGKEPAQRGGITGEVEVSLDSFQFIKTLGNGGFGTVILAKRKLPGGPGQLYAIKVVKKKRATRSSSMSVILAEKEALMIASGHPFITALHSCFQNMEHFFFVMEYVSGGDLKHVLDKLQTFSEKMTQFYAAEITLALQFLHKHGILHRDLKLESILLGSDGHCRVADLGMSKLGHFHRDRTRTYCGTPFCMAPEIVLRLPYGHSMDWWAVGIMIFEMLTGYPPFYCNNLEDKIVNSELDFRDEMSVAAKSIASRFLMKDPAQRLGSSRSVDTVRQHPFFTGIDWQALLEKRVKPPPKLEVTELKWDLKIKELRNDMCALKIKNTKLKRNYETMREFGEDLQNELQEVKEEYETQMKIVHDTLCKEKRVHVKERKTLKNDIWALKISSTKLKRNYETMREFGEDLQNKLQEVKGCEKNKWNLSSLLKPDDTPCNNNQAIFEGFTYIDYRVERREICRPNSQHTGTEQ